MRMKITDMFLMIFSVKELIILGCVLAIIILAIVIGLVLSSNKRKKELELAEEEADFYCDLYYFRQMKEAELKYKAYIAKGYRDRLPNQIEAIEKDGQLQELLDQTNEFSKRRAALEEYLPGIMLALIRCKEEGLESVPKKEAVQLKKLMKVYRVDNKR